MLRSARNIVKALEVLERKFVLAIVTSATVELHPLMS